MHYWTSDPHFDHDKMMTLYLGRPFKTKEEGNEYFIEQINKYVSNGDVLILAGDLTLWHKKDLVYKNFINKLNGTKILIKGNHDYWLGKKKGIYMDHRTVNGQFIVTSHYPMRSWNRSIHGSWNLCGHSHGRLFPFRNQLDISIDNAFNIFGEYKPFSFDEIKTIITSRKFKWWERTTLKLIYKLERHIRSKRP